MMNNKNKKNIFLFGNLTYKISKILLNECRQIFFEKFKFYLPEPVNLKKYHSFLNEKYLLRIKKKNTILIILFLIKINQKNYNICIINKKFYFIHLLFDDKIYVNGTVFIGDLIEQNNNWFFFINDLIYLNGNILLKKKKFSKRLILCHDILRNKYKIKDKKNLNANFLTFYIKLTGYFLFNHFDLIKKNTVLFKSENDVIDFYYNHDDDFSYNGGGSNSNNNKKHLKIINNQEKLFMVKKTQQTDVYLLYEINSHEEFDILGIFSKKQSNYLKHIFKKVNTQTLLCQYNNFFNCWILKM